MDTWIQFKYINLIGNRLDGFSKKSGNLFNFRCPLCGDSDKSKKKKRGYFYLEGTDYFFYCHNCTKKKRFDNFLKDFDDLLYSEARKENLTSKKPNTASFTPTTASFNLKTEKYSTLSSLKTIEDLPDTHEAKKYLLSRKIPKSILSTLYFCPKFMEFTNTTLGTAKFDKKALQYEEPRIIIPLLTRSGLVFGYQGRALKDDAEIRYISILIDSSQPRFYGLHKVNFNKKFYCLEGPIDAFFIDNAIAACGGETVAELRNLDHNKENAVIIYDNEPRNKDTIKKINRAIEYDYSVVIFPDSCEEKDINKMVLAGYNIEQLIVENTFKGLKAKARLLQWKKI